MSFSLDAQIDRSKMPESGPSPKVKLGKVNKFLDDDSEENLERIHLMGMEWWTRYGEEALSFIEK